MKTIRRTLTAGLIAGAFMLTPRAEAQMIQIGAYLSPSLPIGDLNTAGMEFGYGAKLFGNYYFDDLEQLSVGIEAGFLTYGLPDITSTVTDNSGNIIGQESIPIDNQNIITILATPTWHFLEADDDFDFYAGIGAGIAITSGPGGADFSTNAGGVGADISSSAIGFNDTYLAVAPRFGVSLDLDDGWRLDGNVEYFWAITTEVTQTIEQTITDPFNGQTFTQLVAVTSNPIDITAMTFNLGITYFIED